MKKVFPLLLLLVIVSCTSEEPNIVHQQKNKLSEQYAQGKVYVRASIQKTYANLIDGHTRSDEVISPSEFLAYIINTPESQLDSLNAIYDNPKVREGIEAYQDKKENLIIEETSAKDIAALYAFANEYAINGGNSFSMLERASKGVDPLIQQGMAIAVASIDEMLANYPHTRGFSTYDLDCINMVLRNNSINIASDFILELADLSMTAIDPLLSLEDIFFGAGATVAEVNVLIA